MTILGCDCMLEQKIDASFDYIMISPLDTNFREICYLCDTEIVVENLRQNGGTLNHSGIVNLSNYLIVCMKDNQPIGFNALLAGYGGNLYIGQIAVKNNYKRLGIGTELINRAKDLAEQLNLNVTADVRSYNDASCALFESCGFIKNDDRSTDSNYFYIYYQKKYSERGLK